MAFGLLGNKIDITQIFNEKNELIPITIIKCGPCYITQIKSLEKHGYNAIQLGYNQLFGLKKKKLNKSNLINFKKNKVTPCQYLKEYNFLNTNFELEQEFTIKSFQKGQKVKITGVTTGKGNTGNIKLNHFKRGPMSHGSKHHRLQGSLGAGTTPGRVFPGKKMPKRAGNIQCTISGLEIINLDFNKNLLFIKGSTPGKKGNLLSISI